MTVFFEDDFESGNLLKWGAINGNPTIVTSPVNRGVYSCKLVNIGSVHDRLTAWITENSDIQTSISIKLSEIPDGIYYEFAYIWNATWTENVFAGVQRYGTTYRWILGSPTAGTVGVVSTINTNQVYTVKIRRKLGSGNGIAELWVDGVRLINNSAETITGNNGEVVIGGYSNVDVPPVYVDDVVVSDVDIIPVASIFKDAIYAGGLTTPDATFKAHIAKFDMLIADPPMSPSLPSIKALNPNILCLCYMDIIYGRSTWENWSTVWANESWFKHYTTGGRIVSTDGNSYLMNLADAGYRNYCASRALSFITSGYQGVFVDNCWGSFEWSLSQWQNPQNIPAWGTFHDDLMGLLQVIQTQLGASPVVPNGDGSTIANVTSGKCSEDFPKFWAPPSQAQAINDINEEVSVSGANKIFYATCYQNSVNGNEPESIDGLMYCLTATLLGMNGPSVYMSWLNIWSVEQNPANTSRGYWSIFENAKALGSPVNAYYPNQSVYARDYQYGKVFCNTSAVARTLSLEGTYLDLVTNQQVTQITIPAWSGRIVTPTTINKAGVIFGGLYLDADSTYIAAHFGLLACDFTGEEGLNPTGAFIQGIKNKNPNIKIFGYKNLQYLDASREDWAVANANESWFVHDANNARIYIIYNSVPFYLMDVGNAGWRQHYSSYVNGKLNSYAYDGLFADDVHDTLYISAPASVVSRWHADTLGMLQYVKANLPTGKKMIINTEAGWSWGHINFDLLNAVDGMMIEGFYHSGWDAPSNNTNQNAQSLLDCLVYGVANGKIMLCESGCTTNDSRVIKWTYAQYLMGLGTTGYWGWNVGGIYYITDSYQPIMDADLGTPTAPYSQIQTGVYTRNFTKGKAISNTTANPVTVTIGTGYRYWDTDAVAPSTVTLAAYSGEIFTTLPITATALTFFASPTHGVVDWVSQFSGTLTSNGLPVAGKLISFDYLGPDGVTWYPSGVVTPNPTDSAGNYTAEFPFAANAGWTDGMTGTLRAVFAGDTEYTPTTSEQIVFTMDAVPLTLDCSPLHGTVPWSSQLSGKLAATANAQIIIEYLSENGTTWYPSGVTAITDETGLYRTVFPFTVENGWAAGMTANIRAAYGTIVSATATLLMDVTAPIKKWVSSYGFGGGFVGNELIADFLADYFDLTNMDYYPSWVAGFSYMKSINPNMKIIVYADGANVPYAFGDGVSRSGWGIDYNVVNQHEDWFVHTKYGNTSANRILFKGWGTPVMNVGKTGWRQYYASVVKSWLDNAPSLDGIFMDNVWGYIPASNYVMFTDVNGVDIDTSEVEDDARTNWHAYYVGMLQYVKSQIGNKLLVPNISLAPVNATSDDFNADYINACGAKFDEEFIHPDWYLSTDWSGNWSDWVAQVNKAKALSANGKIIALDSGLKELSDLNLNQNPTTKQWYGPSAPQPATNKMLYFAVTSYLMALSNNSTTTYADFGGWYKPNGQPLPRPTSSTVDGQGYYRVFDQAKQLGLALGDYYLAQGVYQRDFANGKTIVNPSTNAVTVSIGTGYKYLDGTNTPSTITLQAKSGEILLLSGVTTFSVTIDSTPIKGVNITVSEVN